MKELITKLSAGDFKALARCITIVENELEGYDFILSSLSFKKNTPVIGLTGPPGAGKSTLVNALLSHLTKQKKKVGVIAIDPTSPFNFGSLLGDRIRMAEHFENETIFIRSLATRGSLGGLSLKTIEITDVMKAGGFDYIFVETVGVGQSEVEIAGLADTTILVLAPGFGDEVQTIKSGIMEVGDIFVINKSDNPIADSYTTSIKNLVDSKAHAYWVPPVLKIIATENQGIETLYDNINQHAALSFNEKKNFLLTEKAYRLIQNNRMRGVDKKMLQVSIENESKTSGFNLYNFAKRYS
jgi:LAO/AO transport system kinase